MKTKICILAGFVSFALCACSAKENESIRISSIEDLATSMDLGDQEVLTESGAAETATPEKTAEFDVQAKLDEAEELSATLEKKLKEDASLTQSDMNDLSYEIYLVWDDLLNELWQALKENLDEETMSGLLEEQRGWIAGKEDSVKQAGEKSGGGSMAIMVCNRRAAELTKERVYELAAYLGEIERHG